VCFLTGLLSHLIQHPAGLVLVAVPAGLAVPRAPRACTSRRGWPSVPLLGLKLWSVYPHLFAWPPAARSRTH
jgi:hypothetical protein